MTEKIKIFQNTEEIATEFATTLLNFASKAGDKSIHIALSGGSTPKAIFKLLNEKYGKQLTNKQFQFWWGDDRCVPPTDDESNYKWANNLWLSPIGITTEQIHRVIGENNPEEEAIRYGKEIMELLPFENKLPVFDIMLLGLGEDGHTASIFPHQMEFLNSTEICEVATHPVSGQKRITLTGPVINNSKLIIFLVTGLSKAEKVKEIIVDKNQQLPATNIEALNGTLTWWLDKDSGSKIE